MYGLWGVIEHPTDIALCLQGTDRFDRTSSPCGYSLGHQSATRKRETSRKTAIIMAVKSAMCADTSCISRCILFLLSLQNLCGSSNNQHAIQKQLWRSVVSWPLDASDILDFVVCRFHSYLQTLVPSPGQVPWSAVGTLNSNSVMVAHS
jgi:hypothetical protein